MNNYTTPVHNSYTHHQINSHNTIGIHNQDHREIADKL